MDPVPTPQHGWQGKPYLLNWKINFEPEAVILDTRPFAQLTAYLAYFDYDFGIFFLWCEVGYGVLFCLVLFIAKPDSSQFR